MSLYAYAHSIVCSFMIYDLPFLQCVYINTHKLIILSLAKLSLLLSPFPQTSSTIIVLNIS